MKRFARATFRGYKPQPKELNIQTGTALIEIEVFRSKGWRARTLPTRGEHPHLACLSPEAAMGQIAERFKEQVTPWRWVDELGTSCEPPPEPKRRGAAQC